MGTYQQGGSRGGWEALRGSELRARRLWMAGEWFVNGERFQWRAVAAVAAATAASAFPGSFTPPVPEPPRLETTNERRAPACCPPAPREPPLADLNRWQWAWCGILGVWRKP